MTLSVLIRIAEAVTPRNIAAWIGAAVPIPRNPLLLRRNKWSISSSLKPKISKLLSRPSSLDDTWNVSSPSSSSTTTTTTTRITARDNDTSTPSSSSPQPLSKPSTTTLHVIVLVHGHKGKPTDLSYLHSAISSVASSKCAPHRQFVIHSAGCNQDKTDDGIECGGDRLSNEISDVIRANLEEDEDGTLVRDVTLSIVGNSLGGLYARYAISKLQQTSSHDKNERRMMVDNIPIHFNVFCSTATPHLGIASHTYLPLPRRAEFTIARVLGSTGRDLFRFNSLLHDMATRSRYLRPLSLFRKRIAYANAFHTDFPVPLETAAFLNAESDSLHRFEEEEEEDLANGLIVGTVYTDRIEREELKRRMKRREENNNDELISMSTTLDSLGWKKVLVDMRTEIPFVLRKPKPTNTLLQTLKERRFVQSRHLAIHLKNPQDGGYALPIGHNMIVAFSRNKVSSLVHRGGRPVMDALGRELVEEVVRWEEEEMKRRKESKESVVFA